jgi:uncharacterized membrane protein YidH (DUF202 family)
MLIAAVAGIARDLAMSLKIIFIDGKHHLHHLARGLLGLFIVFVESVMHVAELALHSQRSRNELHRRDYLLCRNAFEFLDVLELLFGFLRAGLQCCRRLRGRTLHRGFCRYPAHAGRNDECRDPQNSNTLH